MTTTGEFRYLDPAIITPNTKPWSKVDGSPSPLTDTFASRRRSVTSIRDCLGRHPSAQRGAFGTDIDVAGFAVYTSPSQCTPATFTSDAAVRSAYYPEIEAVLRAKLEPPGGGSSSSSHKIARIEIFDHTIRRHDPSSPRQPVQQVHVDQTPAAAAARVRRHVALPPAARDALLTRRYQLINVWRPIGHAATDLPLAVIDWRTTRPADLVPIDLLYPVRRGDGDRDDDDDDDDDDDRGKEVLPDVGRGVSTEGYEVRGETYGVLPGGEHRFYYVKDMAPEEVMFIKCFDSWGEGQPDGREGVAGLTPHTAFVDPATPEGAKGRESIEVRCLVFYE
ncbi:hypothetical protein BT67DRAFT_433267 [Trichocladium antarcticum]|uniref:Uncharacterized protein n=1 Tax=Trichocladium antarcticum TaxID=1450529 RepID=A0AAN6UMQ1_9PEZI|nr:hypothetical protein BT67DRAFT_433267 [Trichocladium antarcticum]